MKHTQSLRNPVLGDAEAVHAEYLAIHIHVDDGPQVGDVCIDGSPVTAMAFPMSAGDAVGAGSVG